jgi:methionine sulfoxide reductase heme-binding subunit
MKSLIFSKYTLWFFLALPAVMLCIGIFNGKSNYDSSMHVTGEFSVRFLVFSMIATPLSMMFSTSKFPRWLVRNRRYFGVAAFAYALLHTVFYLYEIAFDQVMSEFLEIGIITGWIAFFIFVPLAITSNDYAVKAMQKGWKRLQRWVYLAALMTLFHWGFIHGHWAGAMVHFAPVALLSVYRVWKQFNGQLTMDNGQR